MQGVCAAGEGGTGTRVRSHGDRVTTNRGPFYEVHVDAGSGERIDIMASVAIGVASALQRRVWMLFNSLKVPVSSTDTVDDVCKRYSAMSLDYQRLVRSSPP